MDKKVLSVKGNEVRSITLDDSVFGREVSDGAIYHAVRNELANMRVGTASTKTRSEVAGSHRKPWRQKGTGRARSGTFQSPVRVGGGVAFGPRPRDYSYRLPKKMKRVAMKSLLSLKNGTDKLIVIEDFTVESGKTRDLLAILSDLTGQERTVLILGDDDPMVKRAGRNIPWLSMLSFNRLRAHDLFYGGKIVVTESAVQRLNEFYSDSVGKKNLPGKEKP
jgi:large subunit ribosomal protein L4